MELTVIKSENQYDEYTAILEKMILNEGSLSDKQKEKMKLLMLILADWEKKSYANKFESIDPVDVLKFFMDERGWKDSDMVKIIGNRSKVSEVLNRKVPLSLNMIRRACEEFHIPASLLIEKYPLAV